MPTELVCVDLITKCFKANLTLSLAQVRARETKEAILFGDTIESSDSEFKVGYLKYSLLRRCATQ